MKNENILDNGENYKVPEEEIHESVPILVLEQSDLDSIDWEPIQNVSASWVTHKLIVKNKDEVKFRGSYYGYIFTAFFFGFGPVAMIYFSQYLTNWGIFVLVLLSILTSVISFIFVRQTTISTRFNKYQESFYRYSFPFLFTNNYHGDFKDIMAVQISKTEINLALKNGNRINLNRFHYDKSHYDKYALKDAEFLAIFIGVPLLEWEKYGSYT